MGILSAKNSLFFSPSLTLLYTYRGPTPSSPSNKRDVDQEMSMAHDGVQEVSAWQAVHDGKGQIMTSEGQLMTEKDQSSLLRATPGSHVMASASDWGSTTPILTT